MNSLKRIDMKATRLAHFFDCMRRSEICFDVTDLDGQSFEHFFGAKGDGAKDERKGTFLTAYVTDDSLNQDVFLDAIVEYMEAPTIHKYKSPYAGDTNEIMYIVRITEDEDK